MADDFVRRVARRWIGWLFEPRPADEVRVVRDAIEGAIREALEEAERVALMEEELDGPMPDEIKRWVEEVGLEEGMRVVVRMTKKGIVASIRQMEVKTP